MPEMDTRTRLKMLCSEFIGRPVEERGRSDMDMIVDLLEDLCDAVGRMEAQEYTVTLNRIKPLAERRHRGMADPPDYEQPPLR